MVKPLACADLKEVGDSIMEVSLRLHVPKSLYQQLKEIAQGEGISINQFVMLAVAKKIATLQTVVDLEQRAARGSREKLLEKLAKAPDAETDEVDRL